MNTNQSGFTLFELMIAIAVIAILTAIGLPAYQGYVQKAAMTDMLQTMTPYKTSVEICTLEQGTLTSCNSASSGIPATKTTTYATSVSTAAGVITLTGQSALSGLVTMTPAIDATHGYLNWSRTCTATPANTNLANTCNDVFRF